VRNLKQRLSGSQAQQEQKQPRKYLGIETWKAVMPMRSLNSVQVVLSYEQLLRRANSNWLTALEVLTLTPFYAGRYHLRFRRRQETSPE
jgi:hypothetical protein